jgi:hypothetical protein
VMSNSANERSSFKRTAAFAWRSRYAKCPDVPRLARPTSGIRVGCEQAVSVERLTIISVLI